MFVKEIWRYPVKSMAGESLASALLTSGGIAGDRVIQVQDARGRILTSRTYPDLLGMKATTGDDGSIWVDGLAWSDERVLARVREIAGPGARLVQDESLERFDILPLLVATDGSITAFGRDGRRLRPNIVIGGVAGLAERQWEGRRLKVGEQVRIGMEDLRGRCVMTTFDPDTLFQDVGVLKDLVKRFAGKMALNSEVLAGGEISVGDAVELV